MYWGWAVVAWMFFAWWYANFKRERRDVELRRDDMTAARALRMVANVMSAKGVVVLADDAEALRDVADMLERRHGDVE